MPGNLHREAGQLFGRTATQRTIGGMRLSEAIYQPSLVIARHDHELASICLVVEGGYDERYGARQRQCTPGMVIFHPEGEHHADVHHDAAVRLLSIEFDAVRLAELRAIAPVLTESIHLAGREPARMAARIFREFCVLDGISSLSLEALVLELLVAGKRKVMPDRGTRPAWLSRALDYLHAHFAEPIGLRDVAVAAEVHPAHLAREFRRRHACTVGDYVRDLRLEAARLELIDSRRPLVEIALIAGFADQSHFSRAFRAKHGITPSEYRRSRGR